MTQYEKYMTLYKDFFEEKKSSKSEHQKVWEAILSGYLNEQGFKIERGNSEKGNLDFVLNCEKIVHIEATAPTEGKRQNKVPKVPIITQNANNSFADCIRNDDLILLRYTSCINEKLKQIREKNIPQNECIVLAINDYDFADNWQLDNDIPLIVQILFGLSNPMFSPCLQHNVYLQRCEFLNRNGSKIKNNYFTDKNTPINGVILSSVNKMSAEDNKIAKDKFQYIQNPLKENLCHLFKNCMNTIDYI